MIRWFFISIGLTWICTIWANDNSIIEHYSTADGLAHETVNAILQSTDGFIWIGTWYGLSSFDGKEFKTYNNPKKNQSDIPPRKIQSISEDKYGNLWIKTFDHKIYLFDKIKEQFHALINRLPKEYSLHAQIIKIVETGDGDFLLLTKNKDLLLATPDREKLANISLLYKSDNTTGDSRLKQNILYENSDYLAWIGMDYSIMSYKKGEYLKGKLPLYLTETLKKHSDDSQYICIHENGGVAWLANQSGEIFILDLTKGIVNVNRSLRGIGEIQNIIHDENNIIYVSVKNRGIFELNLLTNKVTLITNLSSNLLQSFCDSTGIYWFISDYNKAIAYNPLKKVSKTFFFPNEPSVNESVIWQDGDDFGMFFLSNSGSVYQFDRDKMEMNLLCTDTSDEISSNVKFSNLFFDDNGILWLTSYDHGIFRFSFPKEQFYLTNPSLGFNHIVQSEKEYTSVKPLFKNSNGDIWVGNRLSEMFQFNRNGNLENIFSQKNYNIGNVYHIMEDREGTLWFSTKGQGLVKAVPDETSPLGYRLSKYMHNPENSNSISSNDVYYTYQDKKGRIWVATFGGGMNLIQEEQGHILFKHKYNSFSNYPEYGQFMEVRTITEDNEGRIWVGTSDGLMSFSGDYQSPKDIAFETYQNDLDFINNDVYSLYKDKNETIWISIFGIGLSRLVGYDEVKKTPVLETFGSGSALNNDVILSIIEDNHNNLWLSTEKGISRFNLETKSFRNFDKYDGLPNYSFEESSSIKFDDGTIGFGSREGIVRFNPENIIDNHINYPTYIVDMVVSNKKYDEWSTDSISVKYLENVTLKHHQSMFSIEFAALNYYAQSHIRYEYILEGYEKEWHTSDKNRIASYTNVPPGKYLFKVNTIDDTNPALSSERTLEIKILPPWWKSTWAYVVYTLLILGLSFMVLKFIFLMIKMKNDVYIEHTLSALKINFFTNISHELRTPLTLIKGPIQELKENEKLSEKGMQYMNLMENNTNHMLDLVNQILDFRKIENKKMRLKISAVNLTAVIKSFYNEFSILSSEKSISYNYHLLDDEIIVWADKDKLETVIRNIVSNAFKFTPVGGSVLITGGINNENNSCFVRVEDSGIGISQNKLEEIFERFSQNSHYPGTGIGLALSKELITLHHGHVKVDSIENKGSVFTIELPLGKDHFNESEVDFYLSDITENIPVVEDSDELNQTNETEKSDERSNLPNILLIEDNKSLCNMLKMQLEDRFNIDTAYDGIEGLKKVHLFQPDIVITDQMMPHMSGLELLEQIRSDFQISHIPIILLTARDDDEFRLQSIRYGANAYITKPFSKKHLIARIDQLLNEQKIFREKLWNRDRTSLQKNNDFSEFLVNQDVEFIENVSKIIEDNIDNTNFNIDTISTTLNISRSAFFKKMKSITGLAPVDFVKEIRLSKSVELIKTTDMSVSEIAFAVGFNDSGYFGKCFKKKYKLSPREYINDFRDVPV